MSTSMSTPTPRHRGLRAAAAVAVVGVLTGLATVLAPDDDVGFSNPYLYWSAVPSCRFDRPDQRLSRGRTRASCAGDVMGSSS